MIPAGPNMISCERVVELLLEFLEGNLEPRVQEAMEKHLELCPPCVDFMRQYERTSEVCRAELRREMPGEVREHLFEFLRAAIDK